MKYQSRLYKVEGIVLKRMNFGEQDRIVTLFTKEQGKMRTMAKGVRKVPSRRAGHVEVFTHGIFTLYKGKTFDYIQEIQGKDSFTSIVTNLTKVSFSYYACELMDQLLPDRQEAVDVFDRFLQSLHTIDNSTSETNCHEELYRFALDLLWALGYLPHAQTIPFATLESHIESIIERKLKTPKLLEMTG